MYNNIGLLIKKERENAGLSQKELAMKSGYNSYQTLLKIEKGDRNITISDLYKISNALNLNIDYFMEYDKKKEEPVLWRECKNRNKSKMHENKFKSYIENYKHLSDFLGMNYKQFVPFSVEELKKEYFINRREDKYRFASELAKNIKERFKLGDYPANNLIREIINRGILIFLFEMEDNGSAASFVNDSGAAILLNRKNVPWRRHFDIAHELYHIFTWYYYDFKSKNYNLSDNDFEEKVANAFAAELLMPEDTVKNEIDTLHSRNEIDSFFVLQTSIKFQVSLEAFAARLEFLGYIKKGGKNNLIDKNIKKEFWNQYNLENSQEEELQDEDEFPFSYLMLAYSAYKKTKLTKMKFAKYLNKNIGEIDYYLKQRGLY